MQNTSTFHFNVYFPKESFIDSNKYQVFILLENYRSYILNMMEVDTFPNKIDAFFFADKATMNKALITQAEGISFAKENTAAFIYSRQFNGFTRHELTHVISKNQWGKSALWIEEGFATLSDESFQDENFHQQTKKLLGTKDFIPMQQLMRHFNNYNGNWYRYVEAASMLKFIEEKYSIAALEKIWARKKLNLENKSELDLINEWLRMLDALN